MPAEWLYLFEGEIKLRQIYELLKDSPWNVEYWEEAEVLEVELPEAGSVDFEDLEGTLVMRKVMHGFRNSRSTRCLQ